MKPTQAEWNSLSDEAFQRYVDQATELLKAGKCPLCATPLDGAYCPDCFDGAPDAGEYAHMVWHPGHDHEEQLHSAGEYRAERAYERGEWDAPERRLL